MSLNRLALVLNASYEGVNIVTARRALTLVLKGAAVVERVSSFTVHTSKMDIPIPSVIRLLKYRRIPRQNRSVSRKGLLLRDGNRCQYCGHVLPPRELTLDHVRPKSRGGASTWENLVAACFPCNNRKSDSLPEEAGMVLLKPPRQLSIHAKHRMLQGDEVAWSEFLF
jgi:5-methylcytosine-specific restriction endonuclease McrA